MNAYDQIDYLFSQESLFSHKPSGVIKGKHISELKKLYNELVTNPKRKQLYTDIRLAAYNYIIKEILTRQGYCPHCRVGKPGNDPPASDDIYCRYCGKKIRLTKAEINIVKTNLKAVGGANKNVKYKSSLSHQQRYDAQTGEKIK